MDVGRSINPAIDIGQVEGAFTQGLGWCTIEEIIRGDPQHKWVRPGHTFTKGPGAYKIPGFNDVPIDFKVSGSTPGSHRFIRLCRFHQFASSTSRACRNHS